MDGVGSLMSNAEIFTIGQLADIRNKSGVSLARYARFRATLAVVVGIFGIYSVVRLILISKNPSGLLNYVQNNAVSAPRIFIGLIAMSLWIRIYSWPALMVIFKIGIAIDIDSEFLYFFGNKYDIDIVSHIERSVRHNRGVLTIVMKDGRRISRGEPFVVGFPPGSVLSG